RIRRRLQKHGVAVRYLESEAGGYLEVSGDDLPVRSLSPESWEGVQRVVTLTPECPHVSWGASSRGFASPTLVSVGSVPVGAGHFVLMAGPCAIEDLQHALELGHALRDMGAQVFRGGAFKPRTSPYAFQGLETEGLRILAEVKAETGLPIVTEVMDPEHLEAVAEVADLLQVGSRSMTHYTLLKHLGKLRQPVLLKRGFAATVDELLLAAEYILSGGNDQVVLCERGVRNAAGTAQVILDLGVIPELRRRTHLPILVDPSHGSGLAYRVIPLARAAAAAGADGLIVEVHHAPEDALSDGQQALRPEEFSQLVREVTAIRQALVEPTLSTRPGSLPAGARKD
ncbi:MAG: 3-deoxy-7-phosphoheptulonate synthase, partial [Planctomycetota bacterium]